MPRSAAHSPTARISASVETAPVGFDGLTKISILVRSVTAASSWSTVTVKFVDSSVGIMTVRAPARVTASG